MTRLVSSFAITLILVYVLSFFLPWWSLMLVAFTTGWLIPLGKFTQFFIPFLSVTLLWMLQAYALSSANDFILSKKIATLLMLDGQISLLIFITGLIGGLSAGISGTLGYQCRTLFHKK